MPRDSKCLVAFGDAHFPDHDEIAITLTLKALRYYRPDLAVCTGDLLDCKPFSTHPPDGTDTSPLEREVRLANRFLDAVQDSAQRTVLIEGNHEHRIARFAYSGRAGAAAHSLITPRRLLMEGRRNIAYVSYGASENSYPHYIITKRLVAVHGWSISANATRKHLDIARGCSVIHGHTHRAAHAWVQDPFSDRVLEAVSTGCLCKRRPTYGVGTPVEWSQGFVVGFYGGEKQSLFFVPVNKNSCVLPDGKELKV